MNEDTEGEARVAPLMMALIKVVPELHEAVTAQIPLIVQMAAPRCGDKSRGCLTKSGMTGAGAVTGEPSKASGTHPFGSGLLRLARMRAFGRRSQ